MSAMGLFLGKLRTGLESECAEALRSMKTEAIQGLEEEMRRAHRDGAVNDTEWARFLRLKGDVLLSRILRGETV